MVYSAYSVRSLYSFSMFKVHTEVVYSFYSIVYSVYSAYSVVRSVYSVVETVYSVYSEHNAYRVMYTLQYNIDSKTEIQPMAACAVIIAWVWNTRLSKLSGVYSVCTVL